MKNLFLIFLSLITINLQVINSEHSENLPVYPPLQKVITTIPKSGTGFFIALMKELNIKIPVSHYILETDITRENEGKRWPWMVRKPEAFIGKTVIVIRDLKDVMVSMVFWIDKITNKANYAESHEEKLMNVIMSEGHAKGSMTTTKHACDLVIELLKKSENSIFVIRFEEIIGIEAGGILRDPERFLLLSEMCQFLGYERTSEEVEIAVRNIFGKSQTYNPVEMKVGRWKDFFNEDHIKVFKENWEEVNISFGYDPIDSVKIDSVN